MEVIIHQKVMKHTLFERENTWKSLKIGSFEKIETKKSYN